MFGPYGDDREMGMTRLADAVHTQVLPQSFERLWKHAPSRKGGKAPPPKFYAGRVLSRAANGDVEYVYDNDNSSDTTKFDGLAPDREVFRWVEPQSLGLRRPSTKQPDQN